MKKTIPYTIVDLDTSIPHRVRVDTPSEEMRSFVVPQGAQRFSTTKPVEEKSGVRLKVA